MEKKETRRKRALLFLIRFGKELLDKDILVYASSMAFYLFVALPPFLLMLALLLPLFGISVQQLTDAVRALAPESIAEQLAVIIRDTIDRSAAIVPGTIIFVLWSAMSGLAALSDGLRVAYGVKKKRGAFVLRLLALAYTIALLLIVTIYMAVLAFSQKILAWSGLKLTDLPKILVIVLDLRTMLFFIIGIIMVLLLYMFLPGKTFRPGYHIIGTLFTIVGWVVFSLGFSIYLQVSTNRNVIYGGLSVLVAMLMWIFCLVGILLVGGVLNEFIHQRKEKRNDSKEKDEIAV